MAQIRPVSRVISNLVSAVVAGVVVSSLVSPDVYRDAGLDPDEAVRAARGNPNAAANRRWMAEKIMAFLTEQGMVRWYARPIYRRAHLI
jgi:hypothetical protein